jgi:PAT family beta-lactamase induction signal transducer AmpG
VAVGKRWQGWAEVYRDRRILGIAILGFASGLPLALTFSTLTFWLKEEGLTNTSIGLFAAVSTPYTLKFLWAPLVDRMPLPWLDRLLGRRRSWLFASQTALIASINLLGTSSPGEDAWMTAVLALVVATCSATQDIAFDAYRVEALEERRYAAGAAAAVFGYRIGMLASGAGALFLAEKASWSAVYASMSLLMLVGVATTLVVREPASRGGVDPWLAPVARGRATRGARVIEWLKEAVVAPFADFMRRPRWLAVLLFVALFKLGDALAGVMTNPFLIDLGFSKAEVATVVKTYGLAATLVGAGVGGSLLGQVGMLRSLWICGLLQMASNLVFATQAVVGHSLPMLALTIGLENLAGGMGTAAFVAYLSSLCNVAYTATQYALLSSLMAAARTWLSTSAGWLADSMSWPSFFALTALAALPGLVILKWLGTAATDQWTTAGAGAAAAPGAPASASSRAKDDTK